MRFTETPLQGSFVIQLEPKYDERGSFARMFCEEEFGAHGLVTRFPQWSLSRNRRRHTLRGMHFQRTPHGEAKLVRCLRGAIFDCIIDLRPASPTYCRWFSCELDCHGGRALYVPEGFAHGFQTLTDEAEVAYFISRSHVPDAGEGVRFDDPRFGIKWPPAPGRIMSERDRTYPDFTA